MRFALRLVSPQVTRAFPTQCTVYVDAFEVIRFKCKLVAFEECCLVGWINRLSETRKAQQERDYRKDAGHKIPYSSAKPRSRESLALEGQEKCRVFDRCKVFGSAAKPNGDSNGILRSAFDMNRRDIEHWCLEEPCIDREARVA